MNNRNINGFTLVEVIVTAVIVAVLAGVAVPVYLGYVNDTRQDAVEGIAETAAASANSVWRKTAKANIVLSDLNLTYSNPPYTVTINNTNGTIIVAATTGQLDTVTFK